MRTFIEILLTIAAIAVGFFGAQEAAEVTLVHAAGRSGELLRTDAEVLAIASRSAWFFVFGGLALLSGRLIGLRRGGRHILVPLMLPALVLAMAFGLMIQIGYGDPTRGAGWPGPGFATGVLMAGILGGLVLASPWEPDGVVWKLRWPLAASVVVVPVLLRLFGSGPDGSDTFINFDLGLFVFQPLELVKMAFAVVLALSLAEVATRLRTHRVRVGPFTIPRPDLLAGSLVVLFALLVGLVVVRDLGPTLILGAMFITMFYAASRSKFWAGLVVVVVGLVAAFVIANPEAIGDTVRTRILMWLHPFDNALPYGAQLGHSLWAIASGGLFGLGTGEAYIGAIEAGHTDLVMAHLAEEQGLVGLGLYVAVIGALVFQGLMVAVHNRTPRRGMMAGSLSLLLAIQFAVIFGGTVGIIPLTGVVAPFLSDGKSSMIAFVGLVCVVLRLAEDGQARSLGGELVELRTGFGELGVVALLIGAVGVFTLAEISLFAADRIATEPLVRTLADRTVTIEMNPRLDRIAASIPRGPFLDRDRDVLVDSSRELDPGLGIGSIFGPAGGSRVLRHEYHLERFYEERLRGFGSREPYVFAHADGSETPYAVPDYAPLLPLMRLDRDERAERLLQIAADVQSREVQLSLDDELQRAAAEALARIDLGEGGAIVVIDVDTGRVIARAQSPAFDAAGPAALEPVIVGDEVFTGSYGPWTDMTQLVLQAGSIFKLVTALVAVREGHVNTTQGCVRKDSSGPVFIRRGWTRGVHDYWKDEPHSTIGLSTALKVSCNVFFGQLGLDLGPEPFRRLVAEGVEIGWSDDFEPGPAGSRQLASTSFGQGAAALSALQAARIVAAIAAGGVYRRCPDDLSVDSVCEEVVLTSDHRALSVILKGMRKVMGPGGTGKRLADVDGVRLYGKSGTADDKGRTDEIPYGLEVGEDATPHAWFALIAESDELRAEQAVAPGRLAIVVLVPRGGFGASVAGPAAVEVAQAAADLGYFEADVQASR
ncbi:MAG TPA: FtsW/RodA/SpoVE family cell cycle protein [Myxococcota bacterium]|nr:FtsW/RodA/SpoVE family cell cycle protein [Myxococcota bacterium]